MTDRLAVARLRTLTQKFAGKLPTAETPVGRAVEQTWQQVLNDRVLPEVRRQLADRSLVSNLPAEAQQALQALFGTDYLAKGKA